VKVAVGGGLAALVGEGRLLVGDLVAFGVGEGIGGDADEAAADEGVEQGVEGAAIVSRGRATEGGGGEFGVQLAGGPRLALQRVEDRGEVAEVFGVGGVVALGGGGAGGADVAVAAGAGAVGGVAEMADEAGHAALAGLGEGYHGLDLAATVGDLGLVGAAPGVAADRSIRPDQAVHVDLRGALAGELFDRLLEDVAGHAELLPERLGLLKFAGERLDDAVEIGDGRVVALKEGLVDLAVDEGVEKDRPTGEAIAAGAADLLVVGLDRGGQSDVEDGADVGLVDAHAEGDSGDDDVQFSSLEVALDTLADAGLEAGVVGGGAASEHGGEVLGGLARGGVDDGGAVLRLAEDLGGELVTLGLGHLDDLDVEVVATEAVDEERGLLELELGDDVALDRRCGGGGEGDDGSGTEGREVVAESPVVGAEVVAPGGDAVGLVDGDEGGLAAREHLGEAGDAHALGRDEEELEGAVEVVAAGLTGLLAVEAGVDAGYFEAGGRKLVGLVVHQGDERADDQRGAAAGDGGELVAEALAGAGGHDEQDVAAVGGGAADGLLVGAEGGEAEGLMEEGGKLHGACSVSHVLRSESGTREYVGVAQAKMCGIGMCYGRKHNGWGGL